MKPSSKIWQALTISFSTHPFRSQTAIALMIRCWILKRRNISANLQIRALSNPPWMKKWKMEKKKNLEKLTFDMTRFNVRLLVYSKGISTSFIYSIVFKKAATLFTYKMTDLNVTADESCLSCAFPFRMKRVNVNSTRKMPTWAHSLPHTLEANLKTPKINQDRTTS